jgi:hypothetical protein
LRAQRRTAVRTPRATLDVMKLSALCVTAALGGSLSAGCHAVFSSATDAQPTSVDGRVADAPSCTSAVPITTSLHQDTYIVKGVDNNFNSAATMQVSGPSTVSLLEFRVDLDSVPALINQRFKSFVLTVPVASPSRCPVGCAALCAQSEGVVQLDLLKDSDWDEKTATWTNRTGATIWNPAGAFSLPDNLGTIATANSSRSSNTITFEVNPDQSDLLWSALTSNREWSFRLSASGTTTFAFADNSGFICNTAVAAPTLTVSICQ